jgi:hypothetical protein
MINSADKSLALQADGQLFLKTETVSSYFELVKAEYYSQYVHFSLV